MMQLCVMVASRPSYDNSTNYHIISKDNEFYFPTQYTPLNLHVFHIFHWELACFKNAN